jgi:hypothetical protein
MVIIRVDLDPLGLEPGEEVRFRLSGAQRWRRGTVTARDRDGRVRVTDGRGASRSVPPDHLEVRTQGSLGVRAGWEPLLVRAGRAEQLRLL